MCERVSVCKGSVCPSVSLSDCVCVLKIERRESMCVCALKRERRESVCVCVR
jgi:hypothetical protein